MKKAEVIYRMFDGDWDNYSEYLAEAGGRNDEVHCFAVYADVHIKRHPKVERYLEQIKILKKMIWDLSDIAQKHSKSFGCIFLGDFFDEPKPSSAEFDRGYELAEWIAQIVEFGNGCYIDLSGNHTRDNYRDGDYGKSIHSLLKDKIKKHYYFTENGIALLKKEGIAFHCLPYTPELVTDPIKVRKEFLEKKLESFEEYVNICLFHAPVANAMFDNGLVSASGALLPEDFFDGFEIALGGDYHTHQRLKSVSNNHVYYNGAPFQFNFGHKFDPKIGVLVYNKTTKELIYDVFSVEERYKHLINTPYAGEMTLTVFKTIDLDSIESIEDFNEQAFANIHRDKTMNLRVSGTKSKKNLRIIRETQEHNLVKSGQVILFDATKVASSIPSVSGVVNSSDNIKWTINNLRNVRGQDLFADLGKFVLERISKDDKDLFEDARKVLSKNTISEIMGEE